MGLEIILNINAFRRFFGKYQGALTKKDYIDAPSKKALKRWLKGQIMIFKFRMGK